MTFEIDGPLPFDVDDVVDTTEEIRRGQLVWFDRVGLHQVVVRNLSLEDASVFAGDVYRVDRGSQPDSIRLDRVSLKSEDPSVSASDDNSRASDDGAGMAAALELASRQNYLGSPDVVGAAVGEYVMAATINRRAKRITYGEWDQQNVKISRIFSGETPDFTIIPGWHTAEALGKAVVITFDMDIAFYEGECLAGILTEGFAAVTSRIDTLLAAFEESNGAQWDRDVLPQLNELHRFVVAVLMGTNKAFYPGKHLKDFTWQPAHR